MLAELAKRQRAIFTLKYCYFFHYTGNHYRFQGMPIGGVAGV